MQEGSPGTFYPDLFDRVNSHLDQWLKEGRYDISAELMSIPFSRPKFSRTFRKSRVIKLVRGRFRDMRSFIYAFFCKTTFGWSHQLNYLLFTERYQSP